MTTAESKAPVVAIGDVHGCASLLREVVWPHLGSGAELIFLGDLIDRSPEPNGDRQVIEQVRELQDNPEVCQATSAFGPLATRKLAHLMAC